MHRIAVRITNHLIDRRVIPEADAEIYIYGLECSLADAVGFVIPFSLGLALGIHIELLAFIVCFSAIKKWTGGWHLQSHLKCFLLSVIMSVLSVWLCGFAPGWLSFVFLGVASAIVILFAPVAHSNNPKTESELLEGRERVLAVLIVLNLSILAVYQLGFPLLALAGSCGVFVSSVTLLPALRGKEVKTWKGQRHLLSSK